MWSCLLCASVLLVTLMPTPSHAFSHSLRRRRHRQALDLEPLEPLFDTADEEIDAKAEETEEAPGNGYEWVGLSGHHGLFQSLNWTVAELAQVSMWHATAQHFRCAELVEEKLAATDDPTVPRAQIHDFLQRYRAPDAERHLFTEGELRRIGVWHRRRDVDAINQLFLQRLMELSASVRDQLIQYFALPFRT